MHYTALAAGSSATIGIEDESGTDGLQVWNASGIPSVSLPFAVRYELDLVFSLFDGPQDSLREVIDNARPGATIRFDSDLSGQTITLTNGQITLDQPITIDASALPRGITIAGTETSRIFDVVARALRSTFFPK